MTKNHVPAPSRPRPSSPADNLAENVRYARGVREWSQRKLADEAAKSGTPINQAMISRLENADYDPRLSELQAIADALLVSRESLASDPAIFQPRFKSLQSTHAVLDALKRVHEAAADFEAKKKTFSEDWSGYGPETEDVTGVALRAVVNASDLTIKQMAERWLKVLHDQSAFLNTAKHEGEDG